MDGFDISSNADAIARRLQTIASRQLPFAMARAINDTANQVRDETKTRIEQVFDRPTPFTLNAFMVRPATKDSLFATVGLKDMVVGRHYLDVEEQGGTRKMSGWEALMAQRVVYGGVVHSIVPADGAKLDAYGNWNKGEMNQVLSALKAMRDGAANITTRSKAKNKKRATYFVPRAGLSPGVYRRDASGVLSIVLAFLPVVPKYQPRLGFAKNGMETAERVIGDHFSRRFAEALASAR